MDGKEELIERYIKKEREIERGEREKEIGRKRNR